MGRTLDEDPLSLAIAPPQGESHHARLERLRAEEQAKAVSDKIDAELREEKAALKKKRKPIKVLLLGQSESGKSTTLKNFQLTYAKQAWGEERAAWRTVIHLNLLRNVNTVLDALNEEMSIATQPEEFSDDENTAGPSSPTHSADIPLRFNEKHRVLRLRLLPLRSVQEDLQARLGAADWPAPKTSAGAASEDRGGKTRPQDFFVWSNAGWKAALRPARHSADTARGEKSLAKRREAEKETAGVLASCADDIKALWKDEVVQAMLRKRKIRLDLMPGFFLQEGDVDRITKWDYTPSDDDVVRARLRTLGVQEHRICFETGPAAGTEWCLYDVGGSRTQRPTWFPYFDDCNAIIFLAPISCFDEKLVEDRRVNRLEDSYALWKMICSSKLLANAQIVLFLNKCDLLEKKLRSGVKVKDYVPSYGDRKNDVQTVAQYFASHFKEIAKQHTSSARPFRVHLTSVVDTRATALTLGIVGESILRAQLRNADLL